MIISIQQPEYFPWLGFFNKLLRVEKVVFLDNVQFKKRYFENRNKIRTKQGWLWIKTPVITKGLYKQNIMDVMIDNSQPWQRKLVNAITCCYKKSPYWYEAGEELCKLIYRPWKRLVDFNLAIIFFFKDKLKITSDYCLASSLGTEHSGTQLILEICKKTKATQYLSGRDGRNYLNESDFISNGIEIIYQDFKHPHYSQFHGQFSANMSVVDLYFNYGCKSTNIILTNEKYLHGFPGYSQIIVKG